MNKLDYLAKKEEEIYTEYGNKTLHLKNLPESLRLVFQAIRDGCNIIPRHAEMVKLQCGCAFTEMVPENKYAQIPEVEGWPAKEISFKNLAGIIQARLEEIMEGVNYQIESTGLANRIGAGIVLSGGGSNLRAIDKLVSFLTGFDVRFGKPVVAIEEQLFTHTLGVGSANVLGLLINGLVQSKRSNYPVGMVVSDAPVEVKEPQPVKQQRSGLKSMVSDLFGKAKEGLNGLITDDDQEIN